jgi:superfamily II DNA or RNA helicase/uncharacterized Zn finger protein
MRPLENSELLEQSLREYADSIIFIRGETYFRQNRVSTVQYQQEKDEQIEVTGTIKGSRTYKAKLTVHTSDYSVDNVVCNCPYADDDVCKHIVALGLYVVAALSADPYLFDTEDTMSPARDKEKLTQDSQTEAILKTLSALGIDTKELSPAVIAELAKAIPTKQAPASPLDANRDPEYKNIESFEVPYINAKGERRVAKGISSIRSIPVVAKPVIPFHKRYYLSLKSNYDGSIGQVSLQVIEPKTTWYPYTTEASVDTILSSTQKLTAEEKNFLLQLQTFRKKKIVYGDILHTGMAALLTSAKSVGIELKTNNNYEGEKKLTWSEPSKISARWSLKVETGYYSNKEHTFFVVDFSKSLSYKSCIYIHDEDGLFIIQNNTIVLYLFPAILRTLIVRALRECKFHEYGSPKTGAQTKLHDSEYEHINTLLSLTKEHMEYTGTLLESYHIEKHTPVPHIEIDYKAQEGVLTVLPSIDYGAVTLSVDDTLYPSTSYGNEGIARRIDKAFGTTHIVTIIGETIHVAPVVVPIEKKLFTLGTKKPATGIGKKGRSSYRGKKQIANFAEQFLPALKTCGYPVRYLHDIPQEIINAEVRADFDIDFSASEDWLSFDLALYCGTERVQLSDIESCLSSSGAEVLMKDGRIIRITNKDVLKRLVELLAHFRKNESGGYEGKTYHAPELDAVAKNSPYYTARVSKAFDAFVSEAKVGKIVKSIKIPKLFTSVLRDYQVEGIHWLHFLHQYKFAGILADDMGLGKTLQALAILSMHASKEKTSLIIAPKTLLRNWEQETARFAPHLKTVVIEGAPLERNVHIENLRDYDVVITSYSAMQIDIEKYEKNNTCFNYCVLDEAQYVKNPQTKSSHTVRRIQSDYRLALTGTPLENGVRELWALFDFLMPGFLGHHTHFQKTLGNPIMKLGDQDALSRLRTKVTCFMLRRTKEEVLTELPAKIEQTISCELSDEQNILYQDVLKRVRSDITKQVKKDGFASSQIHILAGLTKLRQICNHPALLLPPKKRGEYPSAKMDACMEIVEQLCAENRKVLIFSQFTSMLDILGKELKNRNIKYSYLTGQTKKRAEEVASFIADETKPVFLISTKAGGVGLNLTVADAVIIFDPWWNPQVERQAVDRTHRIGQTKTVNVYRLRTVGTIEEKIGVLQERKQKLFNALVGDSKDLFKKLTWEDVSALLS